MDAPKKFAVEVSGLLTGSQAVWGRIYAKTPPPIKEDQEELMAAMAEADRRYLAILNPSPSISEA